MGEASGPIAQPRGVPAGRPPAVKTAGWKGTKSAFAD
jgi:hypothetical protein